jgi:uncharacterized membrane protein required for colicin V production
MNLDSLPVNGFDLILVAVLGLGIWRGRVHGMSEELMLLVKWMIVLAAASFLYEPLGSLLSSNSPLSLLACYLIAYICIGLLVIGMFALLKHGLGGKLIGSDLFGGAEYYLGMGAGVVRFSCILLSGLALLNARYISPKEVQAMELYQNDVYGSNFFPGLHSAQSTVFEHSLTGPWIRDHLSFLLIKPTQPAGKDLHQREYQLPQ